MLDPSIPNRALKIVPAADGFHLLLKRHDGSVVTIAHVIGAPEGDSEVLTYAHLLSAAPLLGYVVASHIEESQPAWGDGNEPDIDKLWRATFRAWCTANGEPIAHDLLEPDEADANPA